MDHGFATNLPKGVTLEDVLAQLADNNVAVLNPEQRIKIEPKIEAIVANAHVPGGKLQVVVLAENDRHDSQLRDLATAVGKHENSTVLILSPDWAGTYSKASSRFELEAGEDYVRPLHHKPVAATEAFVGRIERPAMPWTEAFIALMILGALALVGLYLIKARRSS